MRVSMKEARHRLSLALVGTLALLAANCGLDKAQEPPVQGPSETGLSVDLTAVPDTLNADGVSQSVVQMVLRGSDGKPFPGLAVLFCRTTTNTLSVAQCMTDSNGKLTPQAGSTYVGPIQQGIVMATDQNGAANVVWTAGKRGATIFIAVRPYGSDATSGFLRAVQIFQQ